MKLKLLVLLAAVLLFLAGIAQALPPEIKTLSAVPLTLKSGQIVTFSARATDPENDLLTYYWDFGDGERAEGREVRHVYNIPKGMAAKIFNAKLVVSDGVASAEQDIDIRVEKAIILLELLSPASGETFRKGSAVMARVKITDAEGEPLRNEDVYYLKAKLGEAEPAVLSPSLEKGVFEGQIISSYKVFNDEDLVLGAGAKVNGEPQYTITLVKIKFSPASLTASLDSEPAKLTEGTVIDELKLWIYYPDREKVRDASILAYLNDQQIGFSRGISYFLASGVGFEVGADGEIVFRAEAEDGYGNLLQDFRQTLNVSPAEEPSSAVPTPGAFLEGVEMSTFIFMTIVLIVLVAAFGAGFMIWRGYLKKEQVFPWAKPSLPGEFKELTPEQLTGKIKAAREKQGAAPEKLGEAEKLKKLKSIVSKDLKKKVEMADAERRAERLTAEEKSDVAEMISLLRPYKDKYSIQEVEEAALAEGYNKKLARIIAKKLFEEK